MLGNLTPKNIGITRGDHKERSIINTEYRIILFLDTHGYGIG